MLSNLSRPAVGEERKTDGWRVRELWFQRATGYAGFSFQSGMNTPVSNKHCMARPVHQSGLQFVSLSVITAGEIV